MLGFSKADQLRNNKPKKKSTTKWSKEVKERAGNQCEYCGSRSNLTSHHIVTVARINTRTDVRNGVCLCLLHHTVSTIFSAHRTPDLFDEWIIQKRGVEEIEANYRRAWSD